MAAEPERRAAGGPVGLRGLGEEVGQALLGVEVEYLETEVQPEELAGSSVRRRARGGTDLAPEEDLGWCGSGESLVWAEPEVVDKGERKPVFEITPEERGA